MRRNTIIPFEVFCKYFAGITFENSSFLILEDLRDQGAAPLNQSQIGIKLEIKHNLYQLFGREMVSMLTGFKVLSLVIEFIFYTPEHNAGQWN